MLAPTDTPDDVALSLTLAVVASSLAPLMLLDGQLTIIAASLLFCEAFRATPADLTGQAPYAVEAGAWDTPQLRDLMTAAEAGNASLCACEVDFERPLRSIRSLIVQATRRAYLDLAQTPILVAVSDAI